MLTRDEVENFIMGLVNDKVDGVRAAQLIDTDAALRQQVADLTAKLAASERAAYDVEGTIEALKQQLAALQLHWTTEKPTVPGQYWWRTNKNTGGWIRRVDVFPEGVPSTIYCRDKSEWVMYGQWAGPLTPPTEAQP
jgi:hypothetical protein